MSLKELVKQYAYELGADLVGFGGIDRCRNAPIMMSPQGLFPGAKTVVVMAVHHPDAVIELGGEKHPQDIGPYSVQYLMNSRLDELSYRMARFLETQGYGAIGIASSNIWRYNTYKDLKAVFAPDVSHIYMSVVAGLTDMGFNGLALSPEYGARQRFITVITDAEIEEDPLIPPGTVCDNCMLCRKNCPTDALSKEIDGQKVLKIGEYEYRFPNKNLWRCAWGEHFDLDLDLKIPEVVTEEVIVAEVKKHGIRSGEMGQCLKFCVPKPMREFDKSYSRTPVRKRWSSYDESIESRASLDRLTTAVCAKGADRVILSTAEELAKAGLDLNEVLPGAKGALTVVIRRPESRAAAGSSKKLGRAAVEAKAESDGAYDFGAQYLVDSLCYDLTRQLEEMGFRSVMTVERSGSHPDDVKGPNVTGRILKVLGLGDDVIANTVLTHKAMTLRGAERPGRATAAKLASGQPRGLNQGNGKNWSPVALDYNRGNATLTQNIKDFTASVGADMFGVASVERIQSIASQIAPVFQGEERLIATDKSIRFTPWDPVVAVEKREMRSCGDYLPGAKSVIVFGLRYSKEVLRWATRPPAEAVGPYAFQTYVTNWMASILGFRIVKHLENFGYRAALAPDLMNTASWTANPRGLQRDLFSNRFEGVAAGLGYLTTSGHLATPDFGIRQRIMAIVTDAPLDASPLYRPSKKEILCGDCKEMCITTCPSQAIGKQEMGFELEGIKYSMNRIDAKLCDWTKRYVMTGESGFKYLGSKVDLKPGKTVTPESLSAGLKLHDPIKKYRPVVAEPCVINCPYGNADAGAR